MPSESRGPLQFPRILDELGQVYCWPSRRIILTRRDVLYSSFIRSVIHVEVNGRWRIGHHIWSSLIGSELVHCSCADSQERGVISLGFVNWRNLAAFISLLIQKLAPLVEQRLDHLCLCPFLGRIKGILGVFRRATVRSGAMLGQNGLEAMDGFHDAKEVIHLASKGTVNLKLIWRFHHVGTVLFSREESVRTLLGDPGMLLFGC